jgi:hypothetical protein
MEKTEILKRLKNDEDYYGDFGKQFLSNSDIYNLLNNPLAHGVPMKPSAAFLVGGYFHTAILEPDKLKKYKVIESSTRNTKVYKEMSGGELTLLQHEVDKIELMTEKLMDLDIARDLVRGTEGKPNDYEVPGVGEIAGMKWKGKADIINHNEKLVIDLKTTNDIKKFEWSASKYNYDSQAYIYSTLFGYEMLFIVIDKQTMEIGMYDCSPQFYERGKEKVEKAIEAYKLFYDTEGFDPKQYFVSKTL